MMPSASEVLDLPCIIDLMKDDNYGKPITARSFDSILYKLEYLWIRYRRTLAYKYTCALAEWHTEEGFDIGDTPDYQRLYLASSFFRAWQFKDMYYISCGKQEIVGTRIVAPWHVGDDMSDTGIKIEVHAAAAQLAGRFLKDLGFPQSTKMRDVNEKGKRFICGRCDGEAVKTMTWLQTVSLT